MEKFPKTYIGRYPIPMSLMRIRSSSTDKWAFIEETNTIWAQNKNGEWIDTGKTFIRTDTFKGNPLIADRTVNWEMQGLKVFGKSKQASTTGAQLFPMAKDSYSANGLTATKQSDGSYLVNGTPIKAYAAVFYNSVILEPGEYYISSNVSTKIMYAQVAITKNGERFFYVNRGFTIDGSESSIEFTVQTTESIKPLNNIIIKPMLNAGSTALPWEPYTGGMPSPNPEYPQEIVSTGDDGQVDLTIAGANLLPDQNVDQYFITDNGQVAGKFINNFGVVMTVFPNVTYCVKRRSAGICFRVATVKELPIFNGSVNTVDTLIGDHESELQIKSTISGYLIVNLDSAEAAQDLMVSASIFKPYKPYAEPQLFPIPTPNGLPGIPVDSGGNYTDETGQQWICDYVDFARGVKVQNIYTLHVNDYFNDKLARSSNPVGDTYYFTMSGKYTTIADQGTNKNNDMISNYFQVGYAYSDDIVFDIVNIKDNVSQQPRFSFGPIGSMPTLEDAKAWFKAHNVVVMYPLSTPIETPLSSEELEAYAELTSYDDATNIFSDEEVGLEAELVTDKIDKDDYADPSAELSLYYAALAGFVSLSDVPMPSCRESELVRKLIDPEFELSFEVNNSSSRKEKYLWDLINGTTEMLSNNPLSNTEKFLHIMLGGEVSEYPVVHSELEYWMDVCATFYGKI